MARLKNADAIDIGKGVHYVQEDNPHGIGEAIADWMCVRGLATARPGGNGAATTSEAASG